VASYHGDAPGYGASLQFNLRQENEGGALRSPGEFLPPGVPQARRECLLAVHGYNNHRGEATEAYLGFREHQCAHYRDTDLAALDQRLGDVFWPGDAKWIGPLDWLDMLYYPAAVGVSRNAAPLLAQMLWSLPNLEEVDFIAHSLGCRVALETMQLIEARGYPRIRRVCLMAAAVPCELVEAGGQFEALLWRLHFGGSKIHVLHSRRDLVLMLAFPAGQTLAGEPTNRALGRCGPPPGMPGAGASVSEHRVEGAGHSDYWGHKTGPAVEDAVRESGRFLAIGKEAREICARQSAAERSLSPAREIGEPWAAPVYG